MPGLGRSARAGQSFPGPFKACSCLGEGDRTKPNVPVAFLPALRAPSSPTRHRPSRLAPPPGSAHRRAHARPLTRFAGNSRSPSFFSFLSVPCSPFSFHPGSLGRDFPLPLLPSPLKSRWRLAAVAGARDPGAFAGHGPPPSRLRVRAARTAASAPAGAPEAVAPRPRPSASSRLPGGVLVYVGALLGPSRRRRPPPPQGSASARRARAAGCSAPPGPAQSGRHAVLGARGPRRARPRAPPQP